MRRRKKTGSPKTSSSTDRKIVPPALKDGPKSEQVAAARKHEKKLKDTLKATPMPASGAFQGNKGDLDWWGTDDEFWEAVKIDGKTSIRPERKSFSIKKSDLEKISREAAVHGQTPMLAFEIPGMSVIAPVDWAMVPIRSEDAMKRILRNIQSRPEPGPKKRPVEIRRPGEADFFNLALYEFIKKRSPWEEEQRYRDGFLHVSELYDLCPRREVMKIALGARKREEVNPSLQMIFDVGTMVHGWYQENYFGPMGKLLGTWICSACGNSIEGVMPSKPCDCSKSQCEEDCSPHPDYRCRLCVAERSLISTKSGPVPIEEIEIGDWVYTCEDRLRRVKSVWKEKSLKETLALTVKGCLYPLFLTPDHEVFTKDFQKVEAQDLSPGDEVYRFSKNRACLSQVVSLDQGPMETVWNMDVDEDDSFFANEVLVSNCNVWGRWRFKEPKVFFKKYGVVGSSDGILINLPGDRVERRVWEIKTIKEELFKRLMYPHTRHVAQASIYGVGLRVDHTLITYIPKSGWGATAKAFRMETDTELAQECLNKATAYWAALDRNLLPPRTLCKDKKSTKAVKCPFRSQCFDPKSEEQAQEMLLAKYTDGDLKWVDKALGKMGRTRKEQ